jgi:NADPH:quinone reductase-like Zn-dependent oxidoreductase
MVQLLVMMPFISQKIRFFVATPNRDDLQTLADLMEAGTVTPVIDRCYPFTEAAEAIRHLETGRARGKVVVTLPVL